MSAKNLYPYISLITLWNSGSTLFAFLMNRHPEIASIGEASRLSRYLPPRWSAHPQVESICSSGEPYYQSLFWNRLLAGLAARGVALGTQPDYLRGEAFAGSVSIYWQAHKNPAVRLALNLAQPLVGRREHRMHVSIKHVVEVVLELAGKQVYFDSSKNFTIITRLKRNPHLDHRSINFTRDGRGVIESWFRKNPEISYEKLVKRWIRQETDRHVLLRHLPADRVMTVRYEDLCTQPEITMQAVFAFCGAQTEPVHLDYFSTHHHIIGNPMRRGGDETIKLNEQWRTNLTPKQLELFEQLGGELNRANGYE